MKTLLKFTFIFSCTLLIAACARSGQYTDATDNKILRSREKEEIAIYSLILNKHLDGYIIKGGGNPIMIDNQTLEGIFIDDENIFRWAPLVHKETVNDFRLANQHSKTIDLELNLNRDYVFVGTSQADRAVNDEKYPDANISISFSSIGFNNEFTQALVYINQYCCGDYGQGDLYFLIYDNGWKLQNLIDGWIS